MKITKTQDPALMTQKLSIKILHQQRLLSRQDLNYFLLILSNSFQDQVRINKY